MVSTDDADKAKGCRSLGNAYPILADPDRKAAKLFGVDGFMGFAKRVTFIFDKSKLMKWTKVKLGSHGTDLLECCRVEDRKEGGLKGLNVVWSRHIDLWFFLVPAIPVINVVPAWLAVMSNQPMTLCQEIFMKMNRRQI